MKPLNLDNSPCSPTSSNCVIWQGPDIPCIKLCKGDTISDVVFKLATELCTIMDELKVSNYDLSCFNLQACPPEDFKALIQFLINKICEIEGISSSGNVPTGIDGNNCPDCVVTVASCFVSGSQTTMQLVDYVNQIAARVCEIVDLITIINSQISNLDIRVTALEDAPTPSFTLPSIIVDCTLADSIIVGGNSYPIDQVLNALVNDNDHGYCALLSALGQPADILSAVGSQCITNTTISLAFDPLTISAAYVGTWVNSPLTISDSVTNLWVCICDIYTRLQTSPTFGKDGRGVAVFVGGSYGMSGPTDSNLALEYATVPGFGVNALPGALTLKPGDLWIRICP